LAGAEIPSDIDGISLKAELLGDTQEAHDFLYWEFPSYKGQQAVRMGKWKAVRKNIFDGNMEIELYDLSTDTLEANDLSSLHPEIVDQVRQIMIDEHVEAENDRFKITALGDIKSQ
jgi:arylsulfatase